MFLLPEVTASPKKVRAPSAPVHHRVGCFYAARTGVIARTDAGHSVLVDAAAT